MAAHGKRYQQVAGQVEASEYDLRTALQFIKDHPAAQFDESLEMAFRMGVDPTKSDQAIRGTLTLPNGTGKEVVVAVFAAGAAADAAREAGAQHVGMEDLIEKVKGGWTGFDVAVATPEAMKEVRKLGKVLGPRGLMPNPKTGTVTDDTETAVKQCMAGRVEFRMDRNGNIIVPFGKRSFEVDALAENGRAVIHALEAARPAAAKGIYIKKCTVCSTMGPGLKLNLKDLVA